MSADKFKIADYSVAEMRSFAKSTRKTVSKWPAWKRRALGQLEPAKAKRRQPSRRALKRALQ